MPMNATQRFAAALKAVGKELLVDMGGTTAASLSTQARRIIALSMVDGTHT